MYTIRIRLEFPHYPALFLCFLLKTRKSLQFFCCFQLSCQLSLESNFSPIRPFVILGVLSPNYRMFVINISLQNNEHRKKLHFLENFRLSLENLQFLGELTYSIWKHIKSPTTSFSYCLFSNGSFIHPELKLQKDMRNLTSVNIQMAHRRRTRM